MDTFDSLITADLARAARALAQVSLLDLTSRTGIDAEVLHSFERGRHDLTAPETRSLRHALEEFGVHFLPADDVAGVGHGVRHKFNPPTVTRIASWENEGGPAGEDDV
jgi:transcriptional regulator with XRE-family HTH domain